MSGFGVRPRPYVSLPTHRSAQGVLDGRTKRLLQREQCRARRRLAPGRRTDLQQSPACAWGSSERWRSSATAAGRRRGRPAARAARPARARRGPPGDRRRARRRGLGGRPAGRRAARAAVARLAPAPQPRRRRRDRPGARRLPARGRPDAVDAQRFEALAAAGAAALRAGDPTRAAATLREALALWRGPALADLAEPPLRGRRGRAASTTLRAGALADRAEAELALGRGAGLVARARGGRRRAPAARAPGRPAASPRCSPPAARRTRSPPTSRSARGSRTSSAPSPSPELQAAHLAVLRGEHAGPAPRPRRGAATCARPSRASSGREAELERIAALLDHSRLVTLVGPGGAGKTRLAGEAVAGAPERVADGVWMVELAPVTAEVEVVAAVLGALGMRDAVAARAPRRAARARASTGCSTSLAEREAILVLDNCEHLIGAAAAARRRPARALPAPADRRHEPRAAGDRRREPRAGPAARAARAGRGRRGGARPSRGRAVRRPGRRGAAGLRGRRRHGRAVRGDLPPPRRAAAGHRARRRAAAHDAARDARRAPRRPLPPAHRRQPHRAAAPPHAARRRRLELGAARRARAPLRPAARRRSRRARPPRAPPRSPRSRARARPTCSTASPRWSTARCCRPWPARRRRATGCSRRSASTAWRSSRRRASSRPCATPTRAGSPRSPSAPIPSCAAREQVRWFRRLDAERDDVIAALRWLGDSGDAAGDLAGWSSTAALVLAALGLARGGTHVVRRSRSRVPGEADPHDRLIAEGVLSARGGDGRSGASRTT